MSIDYAGVFPCKVREAISDAALLRMQKAKNRATVVLDMMRQDPRMKGTPESEWTFMMRSSGPDGARDSQMRISDLLEEAAPLETLAPHCRGCSANIRASDFGCGGAMSYPITKIAEEWLLSRLPDDLNSAAGLLLTKAIKDFEFDGAEIDAARGRADLYQSNIPLERKWGKFFFGKTRITSSQILHMAFAVGNLEPVHTKLIAYFLGFLDDNFAIVRNPSTIAQDGDDRGIAELKYFLSLAALAGTRQVPVLIDA